MIQVCMKHIEGRILFGLSPFLVTFAFYVTMKEGGGGPIFYELLMALYLLAPLCHLAAELFKCRLAAAAAAASSTLRGGRANLRNASVTFSLFLHEASLG